MEEKTVKERKRERERKNEREWGERRKVTSEKGEKERET